MTKPQLKLPFPPFHCFFSFSTRFYASSTCDLHFFISLYADVCHYRSRKLSFWPKEELKCS